MNSKLILTLGFICTLCTVAGCGDSDSNPTLPVQSTPIVDTAPPAVPTGLASATNRSVVKLGWRPNTTDIDIAGYHVYRQLFGATFRLTSDPISRNTYIDREPLNGRTIYAVTAVDQSGNESGWATVYHDWIIDYPEIRDLP